MFRPIFSLLLLALTPCLHADLVKGTVNLEDGREQYSLHNPDPYTVTVEVTITEAENFSAAHPTQGEYVVGEGKLCEILSGETVIVFIGGGVDPHAGWSYALSTLAYKGKLFMSPVEDDHYIYRLPYEGTYTVSSGFKDARPGGEHMAVDWGMVTGTPILAARGGIVTAIKEDSNTNGAIEDGNYIEIEHADGTFANYAHLELNGALVEVGQIVSEGQLIGSSGNTGYSTGPHLHLHIAYLYYNGGNPAFAQVPVRLLSTNSYGILPVQGDELTAVDRDQVTDPLSAKDYLVQQVGNALQFDRTLPDGVSASLFSSTDLEQWSLVASYVGTGDAVTRQVTPEGTVFYRWETTLESYDDYPEPVVE